MQLNLRHELGFHYGYADPAPIYLVDLLSTV